MYDLPHDIAMLALNQCGSALVSDAEGRYVFVNEKWIAALSAIGVDTSDIIGKYIWDVLPDTKVRYVLDTQKPLMNQVLNRPGGAQAFCNYHPLFKDGEFIGVFIETSFSGLDLALQFSKEVMALSRDLAEAKEKLKRISSASRYYIDNIVGDSVAVQVLKMEIMTAARTSSSVLIEGETGVGKELVAHSIHSMSERAEAPFVRVNCSAIPENLMESEFFGYEDGAFTGAHKGGKAGKLERASGGSLFLDEISELPLHMQPKFLRVLQEREVERVGGGELVPIDTRIIAATNVDLDAMVRERAFRQDLFYRLNVIRIRVPPLRERMEDIPALVGDIVRRLNTGLALDITEVHPEVYTLLQQHNWPGNIRELQNMVERAMNRAYEGVLRVEHFGGMQHRPAARLSQWQGGGALAGQDEYTRILAAIEECGGEKKRAARLLGMSRSTLYEKLKKYSGSA